MEDLRHLIQICEQPVQSLSDETIDSLTPLQLPHLCQVHELSIDGDAEALRRRLKEFRDASTTTATIAGESTKKEVSNGQPPIAPKSKPPINLWAANQSSNINSTLSTYTATTTASTLRPPDNPNRAIHRIHLSSIRHNYNIVQSTAARQQCQVIVVVKADGYGHDAIQTACHLVESCGVEAFAVATLEEGVELRRALDEHFALALGTVERIRPRVRILVLGAPVGYPGCFDVYLHYDIEVMVSGAEVAKSLGEWRKDHDGRRRAEVERVAESRKEELIGNEALSVNPLRSMVVRQGKEEISADGNETEEMFKSMEPSLDVTQQQKQLPPPVHTLDANISEHSEQNLNAVSPSLLQTKMNAATLTNVTGNDLAREVRQILIGQKHATSAAIQPNGTKVAIGTVLEEDRTSPVPIATSKKCDNASKKSTKNPPIPNNPTLFCGIEDAAKASRQKEMRTKRLSEQLGSEHSGPVMDGEMPLIRKKLRWHALVDSGMGRLGFTTREMEESSRSSDTPVESDPKSAHCNGLSDDVSDVSSLSSNMPRDTVDIIQELYDAEVHEGAPIEFYGMCTHMADANDRSTYTHDQMERFRSLIYRVRAAGISIPTISTDNSAALLTPSLTHFDPNKILSHDTRGFVRTGGAIYGQRPAFKQLKAVSTLVATVSNVAIIHKGESVGYDRAYVATENVRIATLTIGFADGYPRELGNGVGRVSIREHTFPVAGNVCMDMLMVELGREDDKGVGSLVTVGDTAILWGPEQVQDGEVVGEGLVTLAELAVTLKTTQSALTCGLDKIRVQRQLVD